MLRKLIAVTAAVLCMAGFALAATAPAQARSVMPTHGAYTGKDHGNRTVTFHVSGNQLSGFHVGHRLIGGAHVSQGAWHETCHDGYCTKGHWQTDFHVVGYWRQGHDSWVAFEASVPPPPRRGDFMGRDHQDNRVHVSFNGSQVHDFTVNGFGDFPAAHVSHGSWSEVCSHAGWCFKGHFLNDSTLVGEWRTRGSVWHAWEAYAYEF